MDDHPTLEARAAVHAALGEPHRLAICDALALSDRSPSELGTMLAIPSNLLAHHLAVLEAAGLLATVRSSGDGRRRYVHLLPHRTEGASPAHSLTARSVLFVCKHNSARSQLAAALWRSASSIPATSAGTEPAPQVHPGAARVAARHGLDLGAARPRLIETGARPDLLVTVCDEANESLTLGGRLARLHWSVPDPVAAPTARAFEDALEDIAERIELLAAATAA